jgi:Uma2 family endonuclease
MEYLIKTKTLRMTEDQFFHFCQENDTLNLERNSSGDILVMEPTGFYTGQRNLDILTELSLWNKKNKLGVTFDSNTGFTLANTAVRSPDGGFISNARWNEIPEDDRHKFAHVCPDFVIELRSESDERKLLEDKMEEWMENGCKLGWLIDPKKKETVVYRSGMKKRIVAFGVTLDGEDVLPGFRIHLGSIFGQ